MKRIWIIGSILFVAVIIGYGLSCTPPVGSTSNAQIFLNITNATGCNVIATLDGGSPVTNTVTGNGGPYTLYTNVTIGNHSIGIKAYNTSACNFNITGGNQTCSLDHPCDSGFTLACY